MNNLKEIEGDLISLALAGEFDIITHGCNCFCTMGAGIAPQMAKAFKADKYPKESNVYKGDINKLGTIDWGVSCVHKQTGDRMNFTFTNETFRDGILNSDSVINSVIVVNSYTQYGFGRNHENGTEVPLDYEALRLCLRKINHSFKGYHIGLPLIGCGLAGGSWEIVKKIISEELINMKVTIVHYKK